MANPWEEYQSTATAGPWESFKAQGFSDPKLAEAFKSGPIKIGQDAFADSLRDVLKNTDWATRNIAGAGSAAANAWEGIKGLVGQTDDKNVANQKIIADAAPVGNIVGNVAMLAPTAFIPGANTVTGAATIGAISNALLTPGDIAERSKAAIAGGAGGALGTGLSKALTSTGKIVHSGDAALLSSEGVALTPGQNAGGVLKSIEDKLTSVPFVGDVIQNARKRGIDDFNKAAINRASLPGMQIDGVGRNAIQELRQGLGQAYDDVLSKSSANALEPKFVQQMASLRAMAQGLPEREAKAFDDIIEREIGKRMAPNGMVNAENLQAAKSGLSQQADNFATSTDGYQRQLGQALKQARQEFQDLISRANPQNADELKAIDKAYANFKRIQRAASGVGAEDGVFTPSQLNSAVKALDKTKDKRAFSEGDALLQDLTEAGKNVMPSKVPDSGTPARLMSNLFSLGGLASSAGGLAAAIPAYIAYSRPGSAAINEITNKAAIPLSELVRSLGANNPNLMRTGTGTLAELVRQKAFQ